VTRSTDRAAATGRSLIGFEHKLGEIGTRIFREDTHHAACEILRNNGGGVAAAAVEPIEFAAVGAELDSAARHRVLRVDPAEERPFAIVATLQILDIAVVGVTPGEAHTELLIGEMAGKTFVLLNQRAFPGRDIHTVDVEITLIPRIVRDQ
jgi:hypothetical protein